MDATRTAETLLLCEGCGREAKRALGDSPDPFCHECGDLLRIVDLLARPFACEGRRRLLPSVVRL